MAKSFTRGTAANPFGGGGSSGGSGSGTAITQTDVTPLTAGYIGIYPQSDAVSFSSLKIERS